MKKSILNLGKTINKSEQKTINGGFGSRICSGDFINHSTGECGCYCSYDIESKLCMSSGLRMNDCD